MSKRFTDTEKWERPWFRKLPLKHKLLWCYVLDKCDQAGVWYVDFELAGFIIGETFDRNEAEGLFSKQIKVFGDRWLVTDFAEFQYGSFRESPHPFHRKLVGIIDRVSEGYKWGINTLQDKDKDKDKDKKGSVRGNNTPAQRHSFQEPTPAEVEAYAKEINFDLVGG